MIGKAHLKEVVQSGAYPLLDVVTAGQYLQMLQI